MNERLQRIARQHQEKGLSKTFVAVLEQHPETICGYYALTLAELDAAHLPEKERTRFPQRIPGVRLGRLAVDVQFQRKKLGELLLVDALRRSCRIREQAGGVGLFVDALDEEAAGFYLRFGFKAAQDNPLLLFLPLR